MKRDLCAIEGSEIGYEILAYLANHPDSSDTLDGIGEWWLLERKIKYQIANLKAALDELVAKGWVLEFRAEDSRNHYRINQNKCEEIQAFLKQEIG